MKKITRQDLYSLEVYSEKRAEFRRRVMEHKAHRRLPLGQHLMLYFEDRLTIHYQIQEMLRVEKIFETSAIEEELSAYNPLIPNGNNWKATMMLEYSDREVRIRKCHELVGIEDMVWVRVGEGQKIYAVADEDLPRDTGEKTSAVHFLRFQLHRGQVEQAVEGCSLRFGVDHPSYLAEILVPEAVRKAIVADLTV